jgi:hypothetical protein
VNDKIFINLREKEILIWTKKKINNIYLNDPFRNYIFIRSLSKG